MKKATKKHGVMAAVLLAASLAALQGCGGGGEEDEQTTVSKEMVPTLFGLPEPGASLKEVALLSQAGVDSTDLKCGTLTKRDASGNVVGTLYATFVVLVKVDTKDVESAKRAGFVEATDKYMGAVSEVFECASRSM